MVTFGILDSKIYIKISLLLDSTMKAFMRKHKIVPDLPFEKGISDEERITFNKRMNKCDDEGRYF